MTEQDPRDEPGTTPAADAAVPAVGAPAAVHRHRKAGAATLTSWLAVLQRPDRRGLLIVGGVLVALLLLAVGYVALIARDLGDERPPAAAASATPSGVVATSVVPTAPVPSGAVPSGTAPPSPSPSPSPPPSPSPSQSSRPPGDDNDGREESDRTPAPPKQAPRRVGPAGFDGFTQLLSAFCQGRGHRTAVLLEGPDYNPKTGSWACTKVTTFVKINIDEACRDAFGAQSQARQTIRGDSRTWRCFDR